MLTRALGVDESVQADITRITLRRGDRVLLCSDGLHALVSDNEIASMLRAKSLKNAASDLVEAAKSAGGDDNITVIVAQMDSEVPAAQSGDTLDSAGATLPPPSPRELADPLAATSDLSAPWTVSSPPPRAESPPVQPPSARISDVPRPPRRNRLPLLIGGGFGAIIVIALIALAALRPRRKRLATRPSACGYSCIHLNPDRYPGADCCHNSYDYIHLNADRYTNSYGYTHTNADLYTNSYGYTHTHADRYTNSYGYTHVNAYPYPGA